MKDIISQIYQECNKFVQLVIPIVTYILDFGIYTFCFCIYFFRPLVDSISQKRDKQEIINANLTEYQKEYSNLKEQIERLKLVKQYYQKEVKILKQMKSWHLDYETLSKWGKDVTPLDEYRRKVEDEWNRAMQDEDDSDKDEK